MALVPQPVVVQVRAPTGTAVVFRASLASSPGGSDYPSLYFSRAADGRGPRVTDTLATDAAGRATVYLLLDMVATEAVVTAAVPALGDSAQVRIDVRPGTPVRIVAAPHDTAVYVGRAYALRTSLVDRYGNAVAGGSPTFATDSAAVATRVGGEIEGEAIGRASIVVRAGAYADTVWASVVPEGRIAAVRFGVVGPDPTELVLVDLDGSAYRSFPLRSNDVPRPAWHPDGSYLVASIVPPAGAPDPARRLAVLDTATGAWRALRGTPGSMGDGYAQFSRDGEWIYLGNGPTNRYFSSFGSSIYRVRADGSGEAERVGYDPDNSTTFDHPSPSPDGSRVAMTVDGSSGMYTLVVPAASPLGPQPQWFPLVDPLPTGGHPRWSPVSEDLLMFGTEGMWIMRAGTRTLADRRYVARGWSGGAHVTGGFQGASWSPDGRWIVAKAAAGLILVEVETDRVLPLAFGSWLADPAWRPR